MCIIIYKHPSSKFPRKEILQKCLNTHKDGFGAMWREGDRVRVVKGIYKLEQIEGLLLTIPENVEAAFHFRMATHGNVSAGNCHPFPLEGEVSALKTTDGTFDSALVHNGIIHSMGARNGKGLSDTMCFVKYLEQKTHRKYTFNSITRFIKPSYGKFVIFTPLKTMWFGEFVTAEGLKFSNETYKPYSYDNKPSWNGWGWKDDRLVSEIDTKDLKACGQGYYYKGRYGRVITYKKRNIFIEWGTLDREVEAVMLEIDLELDEEEIPRGLLT